jgi:DNA-binding transcriptional LysR family regulator
MDRLRAMEVFVAVADAGSFARAGERLRISPPAVTRAVSALEERLGARLFNRTTRSLNLTEAGQRFLESSRRLLAELEEAERDAVGEASVPHGHLTITASMTFGRMALSRIVEEFLSAHPRISASVMLVDRVVNLIEEGIDVAVRIGDLPDSSLVARRIGEVRRVMVASPGYLKKCGAPEHPSELKLHSVIAFTGLMANREWRFSEGGRAGQVSLHPRLEINDAAAAINAAKSGEGITSVLCYMVGEKIRSGELVPVLEPYWPAPAPVQIVYPHSRLLAAKVRAFVDFATPRLRERLQAFSAMQ